MVSTFKLNVVSKSIFMSGQFLILLSCAILLIRSLRYRSRLNDNTFEGKEDNESFKAYIKWIMILGFSVIGVNGVKTPFTCIGLCGNKFMVLFIGFGLELVANLGSAGIMALTLIRDDIYVWGVVLPSIHFFGSLLSTSVLCCLKSVMNKTGEERYSKYNEDELTARFTKKRAPKVEI